MDGFAILHRWGKGVGVLALVGGVVAALAGIVYLNDDYTNRGWGLIGLGAASIIYGAANFYVLKVARDHQVPRDPVPTVPTVEPADGAEPAQAS